MKIFYYFIIILTFSACQIQTEKQIEPGAISDSEAKEMSELYSKILKIAQSEKCTGEVSDWKIIGTGNKACGGPTGFIAYSPKINEDQLIKLIEQYNEKSSFLNKKYNLKSDCVITPEPQGVICKNGKAVFKTSNVMTE